MCIYRFGMGVAPGNFSHLLKDFGMTVDVIRGGVPVRIASVMLQALCVKSRAGQASSGLIWIPIGVLRSRSGLCSRFSCTCAVLLDHMRDFVSAWGRLW